MLELKIESEYIKLDQFLKLADIASTGGHAKYLIQEGVVKVNGEVEMRRGKKLVPGDIVEVEGNQIKKHKFTRWKKWTRKNQYCRSYIHVIIWKVIQN